MMIKQPYFERLYENRLLDVYLSGNHGNRVYWPWMMQPPDETTHTYVDNSSTHIIDSKINDPTVSNTDVIQAALQYNSDMIGLADVLHDLERTIEGIINGLELVNSMEYDRTVIIPLQPPHDECYRLLENAGMHALIDELPNHIMYGVGGVKNAPAPEKLTAARTVRGLVGYDVHLHGFGYGITDGLVHAIHDNPRLLDSIDYSSPLQEANNEVDASGDERLTAVAGRALGILLDDFRRVTTVIDPPETPTHTQATLP